MIDSESSQSSMSDSDSDSSQSSMSDSDSGSSQSYQGRESALDSKQKVVADNDAEGNTGEDPIKKDVAEDRFSENHYYHDGDLILVASDGVKYKVHTYRLQAAS